MSNGTRHSASPNVRSPRRSWMRGSSTTPRCARAPRREETWRGEADPRAKAGAWPWGTENRDRTGAERTVGTLTSLATPLAFERAGIAATPRRSLALHLLHLQSLQLPRERFMAFLDRAASGLTKVIPRLRSDREIADYMRQNVQPIAPDVADETSNQPATMLNPPAIDFRSDAQLALLDSLHSERHKALFRALREDAVINRFGLGTPAVSNTYCNTPDAEIYAAMIMDRKPPTLIEVGSGFSTLIARKAISFAQTKTRIVVYDPYPRTDVKS